MILNHIANGAGLIVKSSPALNTEVLCHGDLHALDIVAIPERLDKRVRESKDQQVVHRPLSEVMVDAKDICFVNSIKQNLVQLSCGFKIMSERFFDDDTGSSGAARFCQLSHDISE